jgi:hypothetical protein
VEILVAREAEVRVKIDAAIAAATAVKTAAPTNLVVTVNTSSDDKVDATTMPRPIDVTVAIPWTADLSASEASNGLIAYDFLEETTSEISDHFVAGITAEKLRSEYQGNGLETILKLQAQREIYTPHYHDP